MAVQCIYSEFSLDETGYLGENYLIVSAPTYISFANCEEWRSRLQNGIRLTNIAPDFQASLSFECGGSELEYEGPGANTGPVDEWQPQSSSSGIWAHLTVTGGNPYQHPLRAAEDDSGLSGGAIAGIVIGVIGFIAIIVVVVMVVLGVACFGRGGDASA
jgi:hypothetical protein